MRSETNNMEEKEKELLKSIKDGQTEINEENSELLQKMLMISCVLSIAKEGVESLKDYSIFKQGFKNKLNNFDNFMIKEVGNLVRESYELDAEMHEHLFVSIKNYLSSNFKGLVHAEPKEIIGRYYDPSK